MKKAIAYVRFSSDEQADGNSIERQEGNIKRYAERVDLNLGFIGTFRTAITHLLSKLGSTHANQLED